MTLSDAAREYLDRLDAALHGVDTATAADLRAGIVEELADLDDASAAQRILELGDPSFVAVSVRSETAPGTADPGDLVAKPDRMTSTALIVATSLLVAFGAILLPAIGWLAGIVLMWCSPVWRISQKAVVTMLPVIVTLVAGSIGMLLTPAVAKNPLVPAGFDIWHGALLIGVLTPVLTGVWLLVRGLRR